MSIIPNFPLSDIGFVDLLSLSFFLRVIFILLLV